MQLRGLEILFCQAFIYKTNLYLLISLETLYSNQYTLIDVLCIQTKVRYFR